MGNDQSSDKNGPPIGTRNEIRPIRTGVGGPRHRDNVGYPDVSPYETPGRHGHLEVSSGNHDGRRRRATVVRDQEGRLTKIGDDTPLFPFKAHWNVPPIFELRYLAMENGPREAIKLGVNLDLFNGRFVSFIKYKYDDLRCGLRGAPIPDEAFGSIGVLGNKSNRLIMS